MLVLGFEAASKKEDSNEEEEEDGEVEPPKKAPPPSRGKKGQKVNNLVICIDNADLWWRCIRFDIPDNDEGWGGKRGDAEKDDGQERYEKGNQLTVKLNHIDLTYYYLILCVCYDVDWAFTLVFQMAAKNEEEEEDEDEEMDGTDDQDDDGDYDEDADMPTTKKGKKVTMADKQKNGVEVWNWSPPGPPSITPLFSLL